jgi:thiol:disulfide interchange protein DsbG
VNNVRVTIVALAAFAALPTMSSVRAAQPSDHATAPAQATPEALQPALRHGLRVMSTFSAASGLTGWVMRNADGKYTVVYTTADGKTLLVGELISSAGENLSEQYAEKYVPPPDLSALWGELEKAHVVVAGTKEASKSAIYVIMDPNCIFCHMLWIALKPYEAAGLQVRWIPVGFLHEDSSAKAAAILKGGEAALEQCQQHFDVKTESGGIAGIDITPDLRQKLESNLQIMDKAQVRGTPGIFYKDRAGHVLRRDGMPSMSELPGITGLPAQRETDPQLDQFRN